MASTARPAAAQLASQGGQPTPAVSAARVDSGGVGVLAAAVAAQTALGGIYAWSTFVDALRVEHGIGGRDAGLVFGVGIAVFTATMFVSGRLLYRIGPRLTAGIGGLLVVLGYVLAAAGEIGRAHV